MASTVLHVYPDADAVASEATALFVRHAQRAAAAGGPFRVLLSGGTTPRRVYSRLAVTGAANQIDWERVHLFWGDERCVPPDHTDSNYRMVVESLISRLDGRVNVHRIYGELAPAQAAESYEREIAAAFGRMRRQTGDLPAFELVLLGMGDDGHTASLFPGSQALDEKDRWVVAVEHNQPPPPLVTRVTVTLPLVNAAKAVLFLVTGAGKAQRLEQIHAAREAPRLPAALVRPEHGELVWMLDAAAASRLPAQGR